MQGGKINRWHLRGVGTAPEYGDTYPLSVQRQDNAGVPHWGVFSAITGGFIGALHTSPAAAESALHEHIAKLSGH